VPSVSTLFAFRSALNIGRCPQEPRGR